MDKLNRLRTRLARGPLTDSESAAAGRICDEAAERIDQLQTQVDRLQFELAHERDKPPVTPAASPKVQKILLTNAFPTGIALGCGFIVALFVMLIVVVLLQAIGFLAAFSS